jgi:predicted  nucleic acid-binding Zn-ribbon protein
MIAPLAALLRYHELKTQGTAAALTRREEARLLQSLTLDIQRRYSNLSKRFEASAVVPLERGICTGCYMRQPADLKEIGEDIHECQHCGRLLYDPDVAFELSVG